MAMMSSKPVRGSRDILPEEMLIRDQLEQKILEIYRAHGFSRIETPALENIDLLLGSDGGENLKMLFTILKRGDKLKITPDSQVGDLCDMGLRYDLTLPLSRFYSNNSEALDLPFKAIQIGNVFRAERPQKGRFRSFKQCDIDIIGDPTVSAEIELISTTSKAAIQIGNVFRAERPQKGRFRSFKQCDIDIIGDPTVSAEIELISTTSKALLAMGFEGFTIKVNDRKLLSAFITKAGFAPEDVGSVCISLDKADKIGPEGMKAGA